ncbi:MAG: hypothetical protein RIG62_17940 [Cyclobacteriaceae bacterium]
MKKKRSSGRPTQPQDQNRGTVIQLRVTEEQRQYLDQLVVQHGKADRSKLIYELLFQDPSGIKVVDETMEFIFNHYCQLSTQLSLGMENLVGELEGTRTPLTQPTLMTAEQQVKLEELKGLTQQIITFYDEIADKTWKTWYQRYQEATQ